MRRINYHRGTSRDARRMKKNELSPRDFEGWTKTELLLERSLRNGGGPTITAGLRGMDYYNGLLLRDFEKWRKTKYRHGTSWDKEEYIIVVELNGMKENKLPSWDFKELDREDKLIEGLCKEQGNSCCKNLLRVEE